MQATVFQVPAEAMIDFYTKDPVQVSRELAMKDGYADIFAVACELKGEEAAEEMFDLSNNPSRQDERDQLWGRRRSLSVGDVVHVEGESYLCLSMGWHKL